MQIKNATEVAKAFCENLLHALQSATAIYGRPSNLSDQQRRIAIQVLRYMRKHGWLSRDDARWAISQGIQLA